MDNSTKEMLAFYIKELESLKKLKDYHLTLKVKADLQEYLHSLQLDRITKISLQMELDNLTRWAFHNIQYENSTDDEIQALTDKSYDGLTKLLDFLIRKPSSHTKNPPNVGSKTIATQDLTEIFNKIKSDKIEELTHDEIRLKILYVLYQKYYGKEMGQPLSTEEIIKEAFPSNTDLSKVFPEIDILDKKKFVRGEYVSGTVYPIWIRITEYGIDLVEQHSVKLRNIHFERRLVILNYLYKKYFEVSYHNDYEINEILTETSLDNLDPCESYQEFEYLYRKDLIEGLRALGPRPLTRAKISANGISIIEKIAEQSLDKLSEYDVDINTKRKVDEIRQEENQQTKTHQILDFVVKEAPQWIEMVTKIAKSIITGQIDF